MIHGKNRLFATLLLASTLSPQISQAAFVTYAGSGTMNGRNISMTLEIDSEFKFSFPDAPEYFEKINAHLTDFPLGHFSASPFGRFMIGDYSITLEGAGTTSNTGGEFFFDWTAQPNHFVFFNDETILNTDTNIDGSFAHNHVAFLDGHGNDFDWSRWESGDVVLAPEIAFTSLQLRSWGGSTNTPDDINLHLHPVPIPAAVWLFGTGLFGLLGMAKRKSGHRLMS
jgi:hypothetical protein